MSIANVKLFSIEDYHRLTKLGFFGEEERVELVRGQFIEMVAKGTAHEVCITNLIRELILLYPILRYDLYKVRVRNLERYNRVNVGSE